MKGVILLLALSLAVASEQIHSHPVRDRLRQYAGVSTLRDPGAVGVLQIIAGFLDAVGTKTNETQIVNCLTDLDTVDTSITAAVAELKSMTWDTVEAGIRDIANALEAVPNAMSACAASATEDKQLVEGLLAKFEHPSTFFFQVELHLMVDGVDILKNIDGALSDWNSSNWYGFGADIGTAMVLVVDGAIEKLNVAHTLEVVGGLLEGMAADLGLSDIENCIEDAVTLGEDIHNAYKEILQATPVSVKDGLADLAGALKLLPSAISACKSAATSDVAKLEAMLAAFSNPASFVFHVAKDLIINGRQIYTEVSSAVLAYHSKDYTNFGYYMGEAMAAVIVGDGEVVVDVIDVIGGLLEGIADGIAISDIENCITDTETVAANLVNAVAELRNAANATDAKIAIHDFGMTLEFLPGAITNCKSAAANDAADIAKMIQNFENPLTFIFVVGKNLVLNGDEIYDEMSTAISDWDAQNWFGFGQNLGEALAKTFL